MNYKSFFLFWLSTGMLFTLFSQELPVQSVRIDTVMVMGNEKTHSEVITREIPFKFPDTLDSKDFQVIRNRILNLFLFERVEFMVFEQGNKNVLLIHVAEHWYFFPVPILFLNEKDWDKISYGLQLVHLNFRGWNEKVSVGGWLGYNPTFQINYSNPWIGRTSKFIMDFSFFTRSVANKFFDFDEHHLGSQLAFGKRLNLYITISSFFSLKRINFPENFRHLSESGDRRDVVPMAGFRFLWDHRDLAEYPFKGHFMDWTFSRTGFTDRQPQFWRTRLDNRVYFKLHEKISLAARSLLIINRGHLPVYDHVFIGYDERIRGYFNKILVSQNLTTNSVELRIPIIPIRYFSWEDAPFMKSLYQNLKFGMNLAFFGDTGMVWRRTKEIRFDNLYSGFGAGIHFNLPYNSVLRLDYAINDKGAGEFIFDYGVWF